MKPSKHLREAVRMGWRYYVNVDGGIVNAFEAAADRIEALEAALRQQRGWVQHWTADAEAGLKPSITALVTAVADIEATLEGEQL